MSTYYGGEQFVSFVKASSTGIGTAYTVPAGRYAEVQINHYPTAGSIEVINIGASSLTVYSGASIAAGVMQFPNGINNFSMQKFLLDSSETVSLTASSSIIIEVKEYLKP